jgi:ribose transport system substrate-binding protein
MRHRSERSRAVIGVVLSVVGLATLASSVRAAEPEDAIVNPYFADGAMPGSGVGKRIGYISLNEETPFVRLVTLSIEEQASVAGVQLTTCDARGSLSEAVACARQLAEAGVMGVLNFQFDEGGAAEVCAAYGDVPTIAIDIHQRPCEVAFMGVDNRRAGLLVGAAMADRSKRDRDCAYDSVILLEAGGPGRTTHDRVMGMLDGFEETCGPIASDRLHRFEAGSGPTFADESVTALLRSLPVGGHHIVLSVHGDAAVGALRAAAALGRDGEVWVGSQGVDPASLPHIACDPHWVADVAYFPERYGRTLIPAMTDILDGKDVPRELYTPHVAVTSDNVRELYPEVPSCD